jgi:hypothetical protein
MNLNSMTQDQLTSQLQKLQAKVAKGGNAVVLNDQIALTERELYRRTNGIPAGHRCLGPDRAPAEVQAAARQWWERQRAAVILGDQQAVYALAIEYHNAVCVHAS